MIDDDDSSSTEGVVVVKTMLLILCCISTPLSAHIICPNTLTILHNTSGLPDIPKKFASKAQNIQSDLERMGHHVVTRACDIPKDGRLFLTLEADTRGHKNLIEAYNTENAITVITSFLGSRMYTLEFSALLKTVTASVVIGTVVANGFNFLAIPWIKRKVLPYRIIIHHTVYIPDSTQPARTYGKSITICDNLKLYEEQQQPMELVHERLRMLHQYTLLSTAIFYNALPDTWTWRSLQNWWPRFFQDFSLFRNP